MKFETCTEVQKEGNCASYCHARKACGKQKRNAGRVLIAETRPMYRWLKGCAYSLFVVAYWVRPIGDKAYW